MRWSAFIWVGIGGFLGANLRYILSLIIDERFPTIFGRNIPLGTFFVNVVGSFLLALFLTYVGKQIDFSQNAKLLIGTGFFGAYTTFSTYANESINLINQDQWLSALVYIIGTNITCLLAVLLGIFIANHTF